jgi:hypothetical protein
MVKTKTKTRSRPSAGKKKAGVSKAKASPRLASAKRVKGTRPKPKSIVLSKSREAAASKPESAGTTKVRVVKKVASLGMSTRKERRLTKSLRLPQYNYMKPPGLTHDFQVGDTVEVYCDHEKNRDRVRGWIRGIVVQVDNKLVAVQFRSNVFLTDGWMVPDRILWYPLTSEHMRPVPGKKSARREEKVVPEY